MFQLRIRGRLVIGYAVFALVILAIILVTRQQVTNLGTVAERTVSLRVPTAEASRALATEINASLAALRGWMLTADADYRTARARAWQGIERHLAALLRLAGDEQTAARETLATLGRLLDAFRDTQERVEALAHTPEAEPARKLFEEEAAPRAAVIADTITRMIDLEKSLPATAERKDLLGIMADVRGSFGLGLANLRAYLLTGEEGYRDAFERLWRKNETRFADLSRSAYLLTAEQREAFARLAEAREAFAPLPERMFEIRASDRWNLAGFLLRTAAAARTACATATAASSAASGRPSWRKPPTPPNGRRPWSCCWKSCSPWPSSSPPSPSPSCRAPWSPPSPA